MHVVDSRLNTGICFAKLVAGKNRHNGGAKKLFFNLRRLKGEINAIDGGELNPEQVSEIAERLGVQEDEVVMMDGRLSVGDQSLNAPCAAIWKIAVNGRLAGR